MGSEIRKDDIIRKLKIGRKISEYISKSHNARARYNAYNSFIKLIEAQKADFRSVWLHRMRIPRKRREGQAFLNMLKFHANSGNDDIAKLAFRLLWLLEHMEDSDGVLIEE